MRLALLSFNNFGSSPLPEAKKVSEAVSYMKKHFPSIIADGPIQSDFALNNEMLKDRFPFSSLNKNKVNTLIFPNLDSANIAYKLIKELNKAPSIGPILMGLNQPVHILQLGASVEEIVNMAAIAVIDSQRKKQNKFFDKEDLIAWGKEPCSPFLPLIFILITFPCLPSV